MVEWAIFLNAELTDIRLTEFIRYD